MNGKVRLGGHMDGQLASDFVQAQRAETEQVGFPVKNLPFVKKLLREALQARQKRRRGVYTQKAA